MAKKESELEKRFKQEPIATLRGRCLKVGLDQTGNKETLIARLVARLEPEPEPEALED